MKSSSGASEGPAPRTAQEIPVLPSLLGLLLNLRIQTAALADAVCIIWRILIIIGMLWGLRKR